MTHTKVKNALGLHVAIPTKEVALHPNKAIDGDKPTLVASIIIILVALRYITLIDIFNQILV